MSCLLPLVFGICLANPSELRIETDASVQVGGDYRYHVDGRDMGTGIVGRLAISMDVPVSRSFTVRYFIAHTSLVTTTSDRGQERAGVSFVYRPWGAR
jgi:hypothetical protein